MNRIHECGDMKQAEVWIELEHDQPLLHLNQTASRDDLEENHHLEQIGDTIATVILNVKFCPYCGEKLTGSDGAGVPWFHYHDFSSWK